MNPICRERYVTMKKCKLTILKTTKQENKDLEIYIIDKNTHHNPPPHFCIIFRAENSGYVFGKE